MSLVSQIVSTLDVISIFFFNQYYLCRWIVFSVVQTFLYSEIPEVALDFEGQDPWTFERWNFTMIHLVLIKLWEAYKIMIHWHLNVYIKNINRVISKRMTFFLGVLNQPRWRAKKSYVLGALRSWSLKQKTTTSSWWEITSLYSSPCRTSEKSICRG